MRDAVEYALEDTPTIDPETLPIVQELREKLERYEQAERKPVVHAHWKIKEGFDGDEYYSCSVCGYDLYIERTPKENDIRFCLHCGAVMDEEGESDE